jgi:hypothetical protein
MFIIQATDCRIFIILLNAANLNAIVLSVVVLSVILLSVVGLNVICAECHYTECRFAECHCVERRYAECRYAECRHIECRGVTENRLDIRLWLPKTIRLHHSLDGCASSRNELLRSFVFVQTREYKLFPRIGAARTHAEGEGSVPLTSLCSDNLFFIQKFFFLLFTKQAILKLRSTVLSLPLK